LPFPDIENKTWCFLLSFWWLSGLIYVSAQPPPACTVFLREVELFVFACNGCGEIIQCFEISF
jgi:hypothetical protein